MIMSKHLLRHTSTLPHSPTPNTPTIKGGTRLECVKTSMQFTIPVCQAAVPSSRSPVLPHIRIEMANNNSYAQCIIYRPPKTYSIQPTSKIEFCLILIHINAMSWRANATLGRNICGCRCAVLLLTCFHTEYHESK